MTGQKTEVLERIRGRLIVSCQALPEEAMFSAEYPIMKHFARAAQLGGAGGIRANSVRDIRAILADVALPVIGIIKRKYGDCPVCITPTLREVEELAETGCEIIAMDATMRPRPDDERLEVVFAKCRERWPDRLWMADCATEAEGLRAWAMGFDLIGTTLAGYTEDTRGTALPDFGLMRKLTGAGCRVMAEGGIWTPEQLSQAMDCDAFAAVVGTAITRPMEITRRFAGVLQDHSL